PRARRRSRRVGSSATMAPQSPTGVPPALSSPAVRHLLLPKWLTARARATVNIPGRRARWAVIVLLGGAFWWGIYAVLARLLRYFRDVPDIGPLLAGKLLSMILVGFLGILLLSNIIAALSTFFLARDL